MEGDTGQYFLANIAANKETKENNENCRQLATLDWVAVGELSS